MSKVLLFIIKRGRAHLTKIHFRDAVEFLENIEDSLSSVASIDLDAGYVLMDLDQDLIINAQSAFSLRSVLKKHDILEA